MKFIIILTLISTSIFARKIINIGDGDSVASIARVDEPTDEPTDGETSDGDEKTAEMQTEATTEGAEGGDAPSEA